MTNNKKKSRHFKHLFLETSLNNKLKNLVYDSKISTTLEQLPVSRLLLKAVVHTADEVVKAVSLLTLRFFFSGIVDDTVVDEVTAVVVNGNDDNDFWWVSFDLDVLGSCDVPEVVAT